MSRDWNWIAFALFLSLIFCGLSSASAAPPPAKIIGSAVSNVVSALVKWLWSSLQQQSSPRTDVSTRAMMKFESGYDVETVFDGTKIGIEPHSIEVSRDGELLILDSENSNMYRISIPLSRNSRPKLITGSPEGHSGHVDGRAREARLNHPKGLAVDDRGNIYIADTMNMAIRKISDSGISTIAGGKWGRGVGHVDGPSGEAKFSSDFDLVYVGISCSLMVVDRGNQAIREIQLRPEDCDSHEDTGGSFHLGVAVLVAAAFFGYMMALLQQRVRAVFSPRNDSRVASMEKKPPAMAPPYQRHSPINTKPIRPPLIPPEPDEPEEPEDGFFSSAAKLTVNTVSSMAEIVTGLIPCPRKKPKIHHHGYRPTFQNPNPWPPQESYMIPNEDEPPPLEETRASPPPNKAYPYYNDPIEKRKQRLDGPPNGRVRHYHPHPNHHHHEQQHHQRHYLSDHPNTYYEKSNNSETNEIVFGAVQEGDGRREAMVIKAVDYGDPKFNHHNIRSRINYMGYSQAY